MAALAALACEAVSSAQAGDETVLGGPAFSGCSRAATSPVAVGARGGASAKRGCVASRVDGGGGNLGRPALAWSREACGSGGGPEGVKEKLSQQEPAFIRPQLQLLACGRRAQLDELLVTLDALAASASPQLAARGRRRRRAALRAGTRGLRSARRPTTSGVARCGRCDPARWRRRGGACCGAGSLDGARQQQMLMRAARHYEGAVSASLAVCAPARSSRKPSRRRRWGSGSSATPARIDLAGGWSDTPPCATSAATAGRSSTPPSASTVAARSARVHGASPPLS